MPKHCWARIAYKVLAKIGTDNVFIREVTNIQLDYNILNASKKLSLRKIGRKSDQRLMAKCFKNKKSMVLMFPSKIEHKKKPWVNDSSLSGLLCRFRASDVGLGNRAPLENRVQYKLCKLCLDKNGTKALNNEVHLMMSCPELSEARQSCGISDYVEQMSQVGVKKSEVSLARLYLGEDGANSEVLLKRAAKLKYMLEQWEFKMKIPSNSSLHLKRNGSNVPS